jgi:signal transduction histidine kinase
MTTIHILTNQDSIKRNLNLGTQDTQKVVYHSSLKEWTQHMTSALGSHVYILDEHSLDPSHKNLETIRNLRTPHLVISAPQSLLQQKSALSKWARSVPAAEFSPSFASLFVDLGVAESRILHLTRSVQETQTNQAMLIHELRNPLMVIRAKCEKILESIPSPEFNDPWVQEIVRDCNKVMEMSARIKVLSDEMFDQTNYQIQDATPKPPRRSPLQKAKLIDLMWASIDDCLTLYGKHGIDIIEDIDPSLAISCDKDAFVRAMINLIKNSFEAVRNLDVKWIKLIAEKQDRDLIIKIIDSGKGAPDPGGLFEAFQSSKRAEGGSGLGLRVVKSYFEGIGGQVTYTLDAGHTCFVIHIKNAFKG